MITEHLTHTVHASSPEELQRLLREKLQNIPADDILQLAQSHAVACDAAGKVVEHFHTATVIVRYRRRPRS